MTKKKVMTAVEGVEKCFQEQISHMDEEALARTYRSTARKFRERVSEIFKHAVWIDANIKGGCVVDPYYEFHFYEEEDAMAFKLRWEDAE